MKRNKFSLSGYRLLTCNQGELVPCGITAVLPGDTIQHSTSLLIRTSPLVAPPMHPVHVRIHHWFVPNRLVWSDWENFITGGEDGADSHVFPTITPNTGTGYASGSLADYLRVPTGVDDRPHSALPFRCYALIWNEWYRDQQLQAKLTIDKTDGADTTTNVALQNVCWEKDYFTTSRPDPQLGPDVSLPLGTTAPIIDAAGDQNHAPSAVLASNHAVASLQGAWTIGAGGWLQDGTPNRVHFMPNGAWNADLTNATAATVNELREAMALQRYEEARSRYGARFTEYLRYLGITSSDARLQRPEYLGGGKATIQFSEVLQNAVTTSGTPNTGLGTMAGHGIGAVRSNRYRRFFEEHGYVISLLSVLPKTIYVDGLHREFSRTTKEDFYQKELEHIGQQEVLNKEVRWAHATPEGVFAYQDRYDEYRHTMENYVNGDFRESALSYWHLARMFGADPSLNSTFVGANPATRIFQNTTYDQLYVMVMHSMQARRLLSKVGTSSIR